MAESVGDYGDVAAVSAIGGSGIEGGVAVGKGIFNSVDFDKLFVCVTGVEDFPDVISIRAVGQNGFVQWDFEAHSVDEGADRGHELRLVG